MSAVNGSGGLRANESQESLCGLVLGRPIRGPGRESLLIPAAVDLDSPTGSVGCTVILGLDPRIPANPGVRSDPRIKSGDDVVERIVRRSPGPLVSDGTTEPMREVTTSNTALSNPNPCASPSNSVTLWFAPSATRRRAALSIDSEIEPPSGRVQVRGWRPMGLRHHPSSARPISRTARADNVVSATIR